MIILTNKEKEALQYKIEVLKDFLYTFNEESAVYNKILSGFTLREYFSDDFDEVETIFSKNSTHDFINRVRLLTNIKDNLLVNFKRLSIEDVKIIISKFLEEVNYVSTPIDFSLDNTLALFRDSETFVNALIEKLENENTPKTYISKFSPSFRNELSCKILSESKFAKEFINKKYKQLLTYSSKPMILYNSSISREDKIKIVSELYVDTEFELWRNVVANATLDTVDSLL